MSALVSAYLWAVGLAVFGWFCVSTIVASVFLPSGAYDPYIKAVLRMLFRLLFIPVRVAVSTFQPKLLTPDGELGGSTPVEVECLKQDLEVFWR